MRTSGNGGSSRNTISASSTPDVSQGCFLCGDVSVLVACKVYRFISLDHLIMKGNSCGNPRGVV